MANDNDINVKFGASTEDLEAGAQRASESVKGVSESVESVSKTLAGLAAAFGVAFSIDGIKNAVEGLADMGEQIERTSAMLGVSTKDVQEFSTIAKLTGGSSEQFAMMVERLQLSLQRAQVPTSQQALALRALGLSASQLIGIPLPQQMDKIADAVARFADGGNKTAIVLALLGRAGAQMIPVLDQGSAGLDELRKAADQSGAVMSAQTVGALSALQRSLTLLKASVTGVAGTLVGEMAPALTRIADGTTTVIGNINIAIQSHTLWQQEMIGLATEANELGQALLNMGTIAKDVFTLNWSSIAADREAGLDKVAAIQQAGQDKINAIAKRATAELQGILAGQSATGLQAPALNLGGAQAAKAAAEQYQAMITAAQGAYTVLKSQYSTDAAVHRISVDQETADLKAALDERWGIEQALFARELQLYAQGSQQYNAVLKAQQTAYQAYAKDHQELTAKQLKQDTAEWQSALNPTVSAWNSQLRQLLSGTETFGQAMKKVFADLVISVIESLEKIAVEQVAVGLATAVHGGPQSLLSGLTGGTQAAATTANTTAVAALTTAVLANTAAVGGGAAASGASAVAGGGGIFSGLMGLFKLFAVPGFDLGTNYVMSSGLAMIHQGESIVPATANGPYTGGGGGGGGNPVQFHFNGPIIGNQAWINSMAPQLSRVLQDYGNLNPSTT